MRIDIGQGQRQRGPGRLGADRGKIAEPDRQGLVPKAFGVAVGQEMDPGHQRVDANRQLTTRWHLQQRTVVADIHQYIRAHCTDVGQVVADEIEFRHR